MSVYAKREEDGLVRTRVYGWLMFLLLTKACAPGVNEYEDLDTVFEATIGQPINLTLSGRAVFGTFVDPATKIPAVLIQLISEGGRRGISLTGRVGGIPPVKEYPIVELSDTVHLGHLKTDEFYALYIHGEGTDFPERFGSKSGKLTVSESTSKYIKGSLRFDAVGYRTKADRSPPDTVHTVVSATFKADRGTVELR